MEKLTSEQQESIAELKHHEGFNLLLDAIQAEIDTVSDLLQHSKSYEMDAHHLHTWRSLRRVKQVLTEYPEFFHTQLEEDRKAMEEITSEQIPNISAALRAFKEEFDKKMALGGR